MQRVEYCCKHHLLGVLRTVKLGGIDHVDQRGLGLLPLACLETTVGVDPELLWSEVSVKVLVTTF